MRKLLLGKANMSLTQSFVFPDCASNLPLVCVLFYNSAPCCVSFVSNLSLQMMKPKACFCLRALPPLTNVYFIYPSLFLHVGCLFIFNIFFVSDHVCVHALPADLAIALKPAGASVRLSAACELRALAFLTVIVS
jgi:hypothetical protein